MEDQAPSWSFVADSDTVVSDGDNSSNQQNYNNNYNNNDNYDNNLEDNQDSDYNEGEGYEGEGEGGYGELIPAEFTSEVLDELGMSRDDLEEYLGGGMQLDNPQDFAGMIKHIAGIAVDNSFANDEIRELNDYVKRGGSVKDYYQNAVAESDLDSIPSEDILASFYDKQGFNGHQINSKIQLLREAGIIEHEAHSVRELLKDYEADNNSRYLENQRVQQEQAIQDMNNIRVEMYSNLKNSVDPFGKPITESMADKMFHAIYQPRDEYNGGTKLSHELSNDPAVLAMLAYLSVNNWDLQALFNKNNINNNNSNIVSKLRSTTNTMRNPSRVSNDHNEGDDMTPSWLKGRK